METRVLIQSYPKPNAVNPPPQWCSRWNLILIKQLVSEILMFESVDARTHGRTDGRRLESHTISSSRAFGSGALKKKKKEKKRKDKRKTQQKHFQVNTKRQINTDVNSCPCCRRIDILPRMLTTVHFSRYRIDYNYQTKWGYMRSDMGRKSFQRVR